MRKANSTDYFSHNFCPSVYQSIITVSSLSAYRSSEHFFTFWNILIDNFSDFSEKVKIFDTILGIKIFEFEF